jgi:lysyl-tRNA synthetase class 2
MSAPEHGRRIDELIAERRAKVARLRAEGHFPYSFPGAVPIAELGRRFAELAPGQETAEHARLAGRLHSRREQGKIAFLDLVDRSGQIQLYARQDVLGAERFASLLALDLGDLLGVEGFVIRTRRGELSLAVADFRALAKALRPPPDKHAGIADVELRHRRRELDLIASEQTRERFIARARIIAAVRAYLDAEGFIEVETPILQPLYGGALARPFRTHHNELGRDLYLRIATELYLKRLIVGGLERVYELGKDFRNEGVSHKHNPEFTMVEWYEAYADYREGAARFEALVAAAARAAGSAAAERFTRPWRRITFERAIAEHTGIELFNFPDALSLRAEIERRGLAVGEHERGYGALLDALLSAHVEPKLVEPTLIFDYPLEISPFARVHREDSRLAERWEAFVDGIEIANAFSELQDADVQRERFQALERVREQAPAQARSSEQERKGGSPRACPGGSGAGTGSGEEDEESPPYDAEFIAALEQGMPPTAGVGLGIDRLVMVLSGARSIREVILFPALRPRER